MEVKEGKVELLIRKLIIECYLPLEIKNIYMNDKVEFAINYEKIYCIINKKISFELDSIFDSTLIKYYIDKRYIFNSFVSNIDLENDLITINISIYKKVDLYNDPFVLRKDFNLIKTTNKDQYGNNRQLNYWKVKKEDSLTLKFNSIVCFDSKELGELNSRGQEFYEENKSKSLFILYKETIKNTNYNDVGVITMYVILD